MFGYPAITQPDPMQELLGKVLGGYKPGQFGAAPTLGNEQGQQDYARQLAEALAQQQSAKSGLGMADRLSQAQYAPDSGALGALSMMAQAYAGKKLRGRELAAQSDAMAKAYSAQEGVDERKAAREAARSDAVSTRERSRRDVLARQMELSNRERLEFVETGKIPEAKRDRLQALEGVNGPGIVNLDQGTVRYAQPEDAQPEGYKVTYAPGASAEDRAAVDAAARAAGWPSDPHGDVVDVGRVRPQPTGQFVTAAAAQRAQQDRQQAATNARLDRADQRDAERLRLAQEEAARKAAEAAKKAASQENQPSALRQDAINFAAAYIGKSPEDVAKMTPEQIRTAVASGGRWMAGPVMGRIPGAGATFNADLDAYSSSAAAKQARINNPTGTVTNADFIAAEKGVFSATKPPEVNADLIYQTLTGGAGAAPQAPAKPDATGGLSAQEQAELDALRKRFGHK